MRDLSDFGVSAAPVSNTFAQLGNLTPAIQIREEDDGTNINTIVENANPFTRTSETIATIKKTDLDKLEDTLITADPDRTSLQILDAAFARENTVGSWANSYFNGDHEFGVLDAPEGYDAFNDIDGYEDYADSFIDAVTPQQVQAIKRQIDSEKANTEILNQAGLGGMAASLVASLIDPVDIAAATISGGLTYSLKAKNLTTAITAGIAAGVTSTAATEAALQSAQETRTFAESGIAVVGAGVLTGAATAAYLRFAKGHIPTGVDIEDGAETFARQMSDGYDHTSMPTDKMFADEKSLSAMATKLADDNTQLIGKGYFTGSDFDVATNKLSKVKNKSGYLTGTRWTPLARLAGSTSADSRNIVHQLAENSFKTTGQDKGIAKPIAAETVIHLTQDQLAVMARDIDIHAQKELSKLGYNNNFINYRDADGIQQTRQAKSEDFYEDVSLAMRSGDDIEAYNAVNNRSNYTPAQIKLINETAVKYRELYNRLKDEAQEVGLLPKELENVMGAMSYLNRVYSRNALRQRSGDFQKILADHFLETSAKRAEGAEGALTKVNNALPYELEDLDFFTKPDKKITQQLLRNNIRVLRNSTADKILDGMIKYDLLDKFVANMTKEFPEVSRTLHTPTGMIELAKTKRSLGTYFKDDLEVIANTDLIEKLQHQLKGTDYQELVDGIKAPRLGASANTHDTFTADVQELLTKIHADYASKLDEEDAFFIARKAQSNIEGNGFLFKASDTNFNGMSHGKAAPFKNRVLDIPDHKIADFLVSDVRANFSVHLSHTVPQIKMLKQMKKLDIDEDLNLSKAITRVKESFDKPRDLISRANIITRLKDQGITKQQDLFSVKGVAGQEIEKFVGKAVIADINNAMKIKGSWFEKRNNKFYLKPVHEDDFIKAFNKKADKAVAKWSNKYAETSKSDIADLEAMRDRLLGQRGSSDPASIMSRSLKGLRDLNYVTLLGGQTIAAATDVIRPALAYGMKNVLKGFLKHSKHSLGTTAKTFGKNSTYKNEMNRMGVVAENVLNTRNQQVADIINGYQDQSKFNKISGHTTAAFSKWSFMSSWNEAMKQFSAGIMQDIILESSDKLTTGKKLAKLDKDRLLISGLNNDDLVQIAEQFKLHGVTEKGVRIANADKWDNPELAEKFLAALRKDVDTTIVNVGIGDKPLWADMNDVLRNVYQFQSFGMAMVNRGLVNGMQQSQLRYIAYMIPTMAISYAAIEFRAMSRGKESSVSRNIQDGNYSVAIADIVDRSGVIPSSMYVLKAANAFGVFTTSRFQQQNSVQSALGASVGLVAGLTALPKNLIGTLDTEQKEAELKNKLKATRRLIPFQNHFLLQIAETATLGENIEDKIAEAVHN